MKKQQLSLKVLISCAIDNSKRNTYTYHSNSCLQRFITSNIPVNILLAHNKKEIRSQLKKQQLSLKFLFLVRIRKG
jgi:hypothetical protein